MQQTSIAPFVAGHAYGRAGGVNWVYFLWALGYESVWVVLIPVQLTELLFPARREEPWLRPRGFVMLRTGRLYGVVRVDAKGPHHRPPHAALHSPPLYLLTGVGVILLLTLGAYALLPGRPRDDHAGSHSAPPPWLVGWILCALGAPWAAFILLGWGNGSLPAVPFGLVLAGGLAWASLTFSLVRRWTSNPDWSDAHRLALVFGGVMACMFGGFVVFKVGGALRIDWIGKTVLDTAAALWLLSFWRKRRPTMRAEREFSQSA